MDLKEIRTQAKALAAQHNTAMLDALYLAAVPADTPEQREHLAVITAACVIKKHSLDINRQIAMYMVNHTLSKAIRFWIATLLGYPFGDKNPEPPAPDTVDDIDRLNELTQLLGLPSPFVKGIEAQPKWNRLYRVWPTLTAELERARDHKLRGHYHRYTVHRGRVHRFMKNDIRESSLTGPTEQVHTCPDCGDPLALDRWGLKDRYYCDGCSMIYFESEITHGDDGIYLPYDDDFNYYDDDF